MKVERSAVVTGCGQGIGRATVERLLADGFRVTGIEVDQHLATEAQRRWGDAVQVVAGDASDPAVLADAATAAADRAPLCGWVNNAAIDRPTNLHRPVAQDVERVLEVNLLGYYWGCAAAVRRFAAQRSPGAIVNISSVHGRVAYSNAAAYDVSKAGVDALTRYVAVEYGPVGIRANAVAPGAVRTPVLDRILAASPDPARIEAETSRVHPLRRIAMPEEVAAVVSFLLSADASFVSGQSIAVDGGLTARCCDFRIEPELAFDYGLGSDAAARCSAGTSANA